MQLLGPGDGRLLKPTHRVARVSTLERAGRAPHYPSFRAVAVQPSSRSPRGLARCPHALHPLWQAGIEPFLARSGGSEASEASRAGGGCGVLWLVSLVGEFRRKQVRATSAAPRAPRSPATRARPSARRACTGAELWRRLRHALTAPILPTGRGVNGAVWGHALDEHSSSRGSSRSSWGWGHRGFLPPGRGGSRTVGCVVVLVHSDSNKTPDRTRTPRDGGSSARAATSGERGRVAETPPGARAHELRHRSAAACAQRARAQAAARVRARERENGSWRGRPGRAGAALPPRSRAHGAHGEHTCAAS